MTTITTTITRTGTRTGTTWPRLLRTSPGFLERPGFARFVGDLRVDTRTRLVVLAVGFLPVTLIGASAFGVVTLRDLAVFVLLPALLALAVVAARNPLARRLVVRGVGRGIVATFGYDLFRWSFLWFGWMQVDPIPHIGTALGLSPAWAVGYAWRYLGNGGGLAVAFTALGARGVRAGMAFGLVVCAGLIGVLVVAPLGQQMLFPLNPVTIVMATVGHLVYGAILGRRAERAHADQGVTMLNHTSN